MYVFKDIKRLLFTPVSITLLIDTEDACFGLNASRPIAKGDLKWRDALLVAHCVNSNRGGEKNLLWLFFLCDKILSMKACRINHNSEGM